MAYTTVRSYYEILEDTLVGFFVRPYVKGARKRLSLAPRFYFFDNGVTRALLGSLPARPSALELGRLFEQWFVQEVVRLNDYLQKDFKLFFWRTSHGAEVDLLVEQAGTLRAAIECQHKVNIASRDLSGMRSFAQEYPLVPRYLVAPVKHAQRVGDVLALSPAEMLARLAELSA